MTYKLSKVYKPAISGQKAPGQKAITYMLLRCQRKQTHHQWTECPTRTNNLQAVKMPNKAKPPSVDRMSQNKNQQLTRCWGAKQSKPTISGQNVTGQEPTTYKLLRCQKKQTHYQWTECPRTRTNNLHAVEVPNKANPPSVDRMSQDKNQQLTLCWGAKQSKPTISGQNVPEQEPTTYMLLRCQTKQTHHQWTECL